MLKARTLSRKVAAASLLWAALGLLAGGGGPLAAQAVEWRSLGPAGGGVASVAAAPAGAGLVWAGVPGVGVWRSIDGGGSWVRTSLLAQGGALVVAADPVDPLTAYAGTGGGLEKTSDGGLTWALAGAAVPGGSAVAAAPVAALAVAPSSPLVVYLASSVGGAGSTTVSRSGDGGATWTTISPVGGAGAGGASATIDQIAVAAANANVLYCAGIRFSSVSVAPLLFSSIDGGVTWMPGNAPGFIAKLAIDPQNAAVLYAAVSSGGLFKSQDGGMSWQPLIPGLQQVAALSLAIDASGQTVYAGFELSDPAPAGEIWQSADGGTTWRLAYQTTEQIETLAVDPGVAGRVYAGTDISGLVVSADAGAHWQVANAGLAGVQVADLAPDPHVPGVLYAAFAALDSLGLEKSIDGGATWTAIGQGLAGASGGAPTVRRIVADPRTAGVLYAAVDGSVFRSGDYGQSWQQPSLGPRLAAVFDVLVDPFHANVVYAVGDGLGSQFASAFASSADAGNSWSPVSTLSGLTPDGSSASIVALAADPSAPGIVYAGGPSGLWGTLDGGQTWSQRGATLPQGQPITRMRVDGAGNLYVLLQAGAHTPHTLWRSGDGGTTWAPLDTGLPGGGVVRDLVVGANGLVLDAATDAGVFVSQDGGSHWATQNDGLSEPRVSRLVVDPAHAGGLYAGTAAGIYLSPAPAGTCVPDDTRLCLDGGRFAAQVTWTLNGAPPVAGHAVPLADGSGAFWFFQPQSAELMVKILNGAALNGQFWVFFAGLSDVAFTLTLTDTATGAQRAYTNPPGTLASFADTSAFNATPASRSAVPSPVAPSTAGTAPPAVSAGAPGADAAAGGDAGRDGAARAALPAVAPPIATLPPGPGPADGSAAAGGAACVPASHTLCLQSSRFAVQVAWRLPGGVPTAGFAVPLSQGSGAFWYFGPDSMELVVKVVDGETVNGHFWIFMAALSDVAYTVTVTDTATGNSKQYVNAAGTLISRADTSF
jgi:hypothetical protein